MTDQIWLLLLFVLALLAVVIVALSVIEMYSNLKEMVGIRAQVNEKFYVKATVVYSNQTDSTQPVVIFHSPSRRLFEEAPEMKWWVKRNYPFGSFPLRINGRLYG